MVILLSRRRRRAQSAGAYFPLRQQNQGLERVLRGQSFAGLGAETPAGEGGGMFQY